MPAPVNPVPAQSIVAAQPQYQYVAAQPQQQFAQQFVAAQPSYVAPQATVVAAQPQFVAATPTFAPTYVASGTPTFIAAQGPMTYGLGIGSGKFGKGL